MKIAFLPDAWNDYLHWIESDRRVLRRLNDLIQQCRRTQTETKFSTG